MTNDRILAAKFPLGHLYEALHKRFRWDEYEIRGRALASGDMVHALRDPNRREPAHVLKAINKRKRRFCRDVTGLLSRWSPDNLEHSQ